MNIRWRHGFQDMEMELGNAGEYEKRLEFCNKVLEMFDWTYVAEDGFRCAVGEELYEAGKKETKNLSKRSVSVRQWKKKYKNAVVGGKHMITREKLEEIKQGKFDRADIGNVRAFK